MSTKSEIRKLIEEIRSIKAKGSVFKNYIEYIRFPFYKNLEINTKIDFDFPFTVFTGQNGSGKSSALHALYGAPEGYSTGNFWFSTRVDPIDEGEGNTNCFIYAYIGSGNKPVEVLKTRILKRNNPDYWEPSRPLRRYDMETLDGGRHPTVKKNVVYLDFRSELSAFDKYFYFSPFRSSITLKSKQDVIRKYSRHLRNLIDTNSPVVIRDRRRNKPVKRLSKEEIEVISQILGKTYHECKLIEHDLFSSENIGLSIYFKEGTLNYSEAFAGRGEFAVAKIVYEIFRCPNESLILLDEPEVSLHPKAQEELKKFLLRQIKVKKLQIVVSTHSPTFVSDLPDDAIKLFYQSANSKFLVKNTCNYLEAFQFIGADVHDSSRSVLIVEDVTAQLIISGVIDELAGPYAIIFTVKYFPGGAEEILKKAATYSEEKESHKFLVLDGDKKNAQSNIETFTVAQSKDINFLKSEILNTTQVSFDKLGFRLNGGSQNEKVNSDSEKARAALGYLSYLATNLFYLPGNIPEDLLWDDEYINSMLEANSHSPQIFTGDSKRKIYDFAGKLYGDVSEDNMKSTIKLLVRNFVRRKNNNFKLIEDMLRQIKAIHVKGN